MAGALRGQAPPFVVDLRGGDVPMLQEVLDLADIHAGIEKQRGRSWPVENAASRGICVSCCRPATALPLSLRIPLNHSVNGGRVHPAVDQARARADLRTKEGARAELRVRRVEDRDGEAELGGGGKVFIEARKGRDAPADGFRGETGIDELVAEALYVFDGGLEHFHGVLGPGEHQKVDGAHDVGAVGALAIGA